jgi:hypothetical protein
MRSNDATVGIAIAPAANAKAGTKANKAVPLSAGTFGGTLAAIAGLVGLTVLQFRCIYQNTAHLMVWHGGVLILSIAAGALLSVAIERRVRLR